MPQSVNYIVKNSAGKYLLQMRNGKEGICNPLMWNFFGGGLENSDEEPLKTALREMKEETGIVAAEKDFDYLGTVEEDEKMVYIFKYLPILEWSDIMVNEGAGAGWFTKEEILRIPITEKAKLIVDKYI